MKSGYFQVPNSLFELNDLNAYQKVVLMYFYRAGNNGAQIFPSYATIAVCCSMSESQAKKVVRDLETMGAINVRRRRSSKGHNHTNLYQINEPLLEQMRLENQRIRHTDAKPPGDGVCGEPGGTRGGQRVVSDVDPIKNHIDKEPEIKNHITGDAQANAPLSFESYMVSNKSKEGSEAAELVRYYLKEYQRTLGREHKRMKPSVWGKALNEITDYYMDFGTETRHRETGDIVQIKTLIDVYFSRIKKFDQPCDFSLPHFNSPGIKAVLYHEQWDFIK